MNRTIVNGDEVTEEGDSRMMGTLGTVMINDGQHVAITASHTVVTGEVRTAFSRYFFFTSITAKFHAGKVVRWECDNVRTVCLLLRSEASLIRCLLPQRVLK